MKPFIATPKNPDLAPLIVHVVDALCTLEHSMPPRIRLEDHEGVYAWLDHARDAQGTQIPVLVLPPRSCRALWDLDVPEKRYVELDRDWREEVRAVALEERDRRDEEARRYSSEHPELPVRVSRSFGQTTYYHARIEKANIARVELTDALCNYLDRLLRAYRPGDLGVGKRLNYEYTDWDDSGGTAHTTVGEIQRLADEVLQARRTQEAARKAREAQEQEAAAGREILHVTCEMRPHRKDLSGVVLNRPAPQAGAFLIQERLPRPHWEQLHEAGAWYWSQDDLEEFDMFTSEKGWRYGYPALEAALALGYALQIDEHLPVTTPEALQALFEDKA